MLFNIIYKTLNYSELKNGFSLKINPNFVRPSNYLYPIPFKNCIIIDLEENIDVTFKLHTEYNIAIPSILGIELEHLYFLVIEFSDFDYTPKIINKYDVINCILGTNLKNGEICLNFIDIGQDLNSVSTLDVDGYIERLYKLDHEDA